MDNESQPLLGLSLSQMIGMLLTYKWSILFLTTLGVIGAAFLYLTAEPVYVSEAKLLVRYLKEGISLEEGDGAARVKTPDRSGANIINSEVEILTSRSLIEEVVDDIGPELLVESEGDAALARSRAIIDVLVNLRVNVPRSSNIIRMEFFGKNPKVVQQVLDRLVDLYLRKHAIVHNTAGEYEFLSQQTDQIRTRLSQTEEELRHLKRETGVTTLAETKLALATRVEKLHDGLRSARARLAAAKARVESAGIEPNGGVSNLHESAAAALDTAVRSRIVALHQALRTLREREMQLLTSFSSESSPVRDVRFEIARAEERVRIEMKAAGLDGGISSDFVESVDAAAQQADVAALEASERVLATYLNETRDSIEMLNNREAQLVRLQRQWEMLEANYRYYAQSLEHARIVDALNSGRAANISIVQAASLPIRPQYPTRERNAGISLVGGLGLALLLAFVRELVKSDRLVLPAEVAKVVGAPTLITLPYAGGGLHIGSGRGKQRPLALPSHEGQPPEVGPEEAGLHRQLRSHYDALCDRLMMTLNGHTEGPVLLGVTACEPGVGVTTISAGLGGALSRLGEGRVLLVDTTATSSGGMQHGDSAGMIDVLNDGQGNVAIIQPNLYMLSAREITDDVSHVGMFQKLKDLVKTLQQSDYRYVLMELPPISDTSSALALARHLDGVVIVLESEKDRKGQVARAAGLLREAGATVLGTVLNKRKQQGWELE